MYIEYAGGKLTLESSKDLHFNEEIRGFILNQQTSSPLSVVKFNMILEHGEKFSDSVIFIGEEEELLKFIEDKISYATWTGHYKNIKAELLYTSAFTYAINCFHLESELKERVKNTRI